MKAHTMAETLTLHGAWFPKVTPQNCPHCEYDRRFPATEMGGWIYTGNNGPYVACPMCNDDGSHPREPLTGR